MKNVFIILLFLSSVSYGQIIRQKQVLGLQDSLNEKTAAISTKLTSSDTFFISQYISKLASRPGIYFTKDTIVIAGDSYVTGSGATSSAYRWTTLMAKYLNAIELNYGTGGTTLEKRSPVDWIASPNFRDLVSSLPAKRKGLKLLVIAYGLNDIGENGANYNPTNFKLDFDTAISYLITTKGWTRENILILSPYYINEVGYQAYAALNGGNGAPTVARHEQFVEASKQTALKWGTLYLDIYNDQKRNDTTLLGGDGIHPNNAGYNFIAKDVAHVFGKVNIPDSALYLYNNSDDYPLAIFTDKNAGTGIYGKNSNTGSGAAMASVYYNDRNNFLQWYMGSVANAFAPNGALIRTNGTGGLLLRGDSGSIKIMNGAIMSAIIDTTLAGTGERMVVAKADGSLRTQAIPSSGGGGTVTDVTGTSNRITSTGGTTPAIDISSSYVGQSSITTLGTIGTGVWNGTAVTVPYGGTGVTSTTAYGVIAGGTTSTGALQNIGTGASGQILVSNGSAALPSFQNISLPPIYTEQNTVASFDPQPSAQDVYALKIQDQNFTISNPATAPARFKMFIIRVKDDGTPRTITWGNKYRAGDIALPTVTIASKTMYFQFIYNQTDDKYDFVGYRKDF